jgi:hypothetical protein
MHVEILYLSSTGQSAQTTEAVLEALCGTALQTAECKIPHTTREDLIKPCLTEIVRLILGKQQAKRWIRYHFQTAP